MVEFFNLEMSLRSGRVVEAQIQLTFSIVAVCGYEVSFHWLNKSMQIVDEITLTRREISTS